MAGLANLAGIAPLVDRTLFGGAMRDRLRSTARQDLLALEQEFLETGFFPEGTPLTVREQVLSRIGQATESQALRVGDRERIAELERVAEPFSVPRVRGDEFEAFRREDTGEIGFAPVGVQRGSRAGFPVARVSQTPPAGFDAAEHQQLVEAGLTPEALQQEAAGADDPGHFEALARLVQPGAPKVEELRPFGRPTPPPDVAERLRAQLEELEMRRAQAQEQLRVARTGFAARGPGGGREALSQAESAAAERTAEEVADLSKAFLQGQDRIEDAMIRLREKLAKDTITDGERRAALARFETMMNRVIRRSPDQLRAQLEAMTEEAKQRLVTEGWLVPESTLDSEDTPETPSESSAASPRPGAVPAGDLITHAQRLRPTSPRGDRLKDVLIEVLGEAAQRGEHLTPTMLQGRLARRIPGMALEEAMGNLGESLRALGDAAVPDAVSGFLSEFFG